MADRRHARRARPRAVLAVLVAPALAATGCGGAQAPARPVERVLRLTLDEYSITPQDVSARAGRLTIVARDVGRLTHNVHVQIPAAAPGEQPRDLGGTATMRPGQTARVTLRLRRGRYELVCRNQNHDDLGERGVLVVR